MARNPNTNSKGEPFDEATIEAVWRKTRQDSPFESHRKDPCGATIQRTRYGKTEESGWEIDHIKPVALGGGDELDNLQALQWENNRHKGDIYPDWTCKVTH